MEYHSQYLNQPQSSSSLMLKSSTTTTRQRWQPQVKSSPTSHNHHNVTPSTRVSSSIIMPPSASLPVTSNSVSTSCCRNITTISRSIRPILPYTIRKNRSTKSSSRGGTILNELLSPKLMLVSVVLLLTIVIPSIQADHCPSMCECLWRSGKQTAECAGQGLMSIPSGVSPSSQVLNLSRNNFQTLPHKVFQERGLINLQKIYLSECKLGMIAADAFIQLTNLIELDLSSNLLTSVPSESLQQTTALRRLNLKRNPIQVIHEDSLAQLAHLRFLDLSDCQVESIDVNAFKGLKTLEQLKLDGNRLSTLPGSIFESVPLTSIGLHRNPWRCDCELRSTIEWLYKARLVPNLWPTCSTPIKLNGAMWNSMGLDSYACPPVFKVRETEMKAPLGTNLSLVCIIKSTPKAKVFWSYAEIGGDSNKNATTSDIFGGPKYTISDDTNSGVDQIISTLTIHSLDYDDSRRNYICSAENSAAMTSKNFTISLYSSPISAISSWTKVEIAGTITVFLLVFVIGIVLIAVCLLRYRKDGRDSSGGNNLNGKESKNGLSSIDVLKSIKSFGRSIHNSPEHKVINDASLKASKTDIGSSSGYGSNGVTPDLTSNVIKSMDNYQPMCPPIDFYPGLLQVTNSMCKTDSCEMIVPNDQHHHQTLHHHTSGLNGHLQQHQQQQQSIHLMSPLDGRQNRSPATFNNYENYDAYTAYHHGNYNQLNFRDSLGYGHFDAPHYYTSTSQPPTTTNSYTTNATTPNGDVDIGDNVLRGGSGTVNVLDEIGIGNCGPSPPSSQSMTNCIDKRDNSNNIMSSMPTTSQSSDIRLTSVSPLHPPIHEANLINLHHVNVLGQGSYCNISHPTIVRYSPDEGYAEEQANPSFVLEGTEV